MTTAVVVVGAASVRQPAAEQLTGHQQALAEQKITLPISVVSG